MSTTEQSFPITAPTTWPSTPSAPGATYVNGLQIVYSPWDFSLLFSRAVPTEIHREQSEAGVRLRVDAVPQIVETLVMSPQHAKAMLKALEDNIKAYEKDHGEIPLIEPSSAPGGREAGPEGAN